MDAKIKRALDFCFHPKKGRPGLKKISSDPERVNDHLDKAIHNLRAMNIMYENGVFDWTVVCGYYSFYHATLAALFKIGIEARNHYCAMLAFNAFYVEKTKIKKEYSNMLKKAGKMESKYSNTLKRAQEDRIKVQYDIMVLENEDAEWIIEEAKNFVDKIAETISS